MQDTIIATLLQNAYSLSQLRARVRIIKNHLNEKFFGKTQEEQLSLGDKAWLSSLPPDFLSQFTPLNVNEKLQELDKEVGSIEPLTVFLAFEIPDNQVNNIGIWLRREINPKLVFEIKFDSSLVGGCAFSWKGVYKDYSIRARIDAQREQILASFKQFTK